MLLQTLAAAAVASGRFALATRGGRHTLVSPDGQDIFVTALNHLTGPFFYDDIQGANGLLNVAPGAPACRAYDGPCRAADLLNVRYNGSWEAATRDFVAFSRGAGFNAAGYEFAPTAGLDWPYLPDLFVTNASHILQRSGLASFPDVWAPAFATSVERRVAAWVRHDQRTGAARVPRSVVGYYMEDQPVWSVNPLGDWTSATRGRTAGPGKEVYVRWLQRRYNGDFAAAARAYELPSRLRGWDDLTGYAFAGLERTAAVTDDDTEFLGVVAEHYFALASATIRKHDPGALIFGQRFIGNDCPAPVLRAAGRHFDVVSVQPQDFSPITPERVDALVANLHNISLLAGGAPIFVADESTHFFQEVPNPPFEQPMRPSNCKLDNRTKRLPAWAGCTADEAGAGQMYEQLLLALHKSSFAVGYAHCQYIDRAVCHEWPAPGSCDIKRPGWSPNLKQGLKDAAGHPKPKLVAAITAANRKVHQASAAPMTAVHKDGLLCRTPFRCVKPFTITAPTPAASQVAIKGARPEPLPPPSPIRPLTLGAQWRAPRSTRATWTMSSSTSDAEGEAVSLDRMWQGRLLRWALEPPGSKWETLVRERAGGCVWGGRGG